MTEEGSVDNDNKNISVVICERDIHNDQPTCDAVLKISKGMI